MILSFVKYRPNTAISSEVANFAEGGSFTSADMDALVLRWNNTGGAGKYLVQGDRTATTGQTFSPGDKARIIQRADALIADISLDYWTRPTMYYPTGPGNPSSPIETTYIPQFAISDPTIIGQYTLAAAFAYRMSGNEDYLAIAQDSLWDNFINYDFLDFTDLSTWQHDVLHDVNPSFFIAEMINKVLNAYDLIKESFTNPERLIIDTWFLNAAEWFNTDIEPDINQYFTNRLGGNYTVLGGYTGYSSSTTHDSGETIPSLGKHFNNRKMDIYKMVLGVGIHIYKRGVETGNTDFIARGTVLKESARRFVKDTIKFAVFPSGLDAELERRDEASQKGIFYWGVKLDAMWKMGYMDAINGNTEILDYTTSAGYLSTTDGSTQKNLTMTTARLCDLFAGQSPIIYNTYLAVAHQMDGLNEATGERYIGDCTIALTAYRWYKHIGNETFANLLESQYKRTRSGCWAFPQNPSGNGANSALTGSGGTSAGDYFQHAELGHLNPFES